MQEKLPDNFVHLVGSVKRNGEAKYSANGLPFIDFCLSVPSGDNGEHVYIDCYAYGPIVDDEFEGFVSAGETIEVYGRLTFRSHTDSKGVMRSGKVVVVDEVVTED